MVEFRRGNYTKSRKLLLEVLSLQTPLSPLQKSHVYHNLGIIAHIHKDNEEALTYFSKVLDHNPKSRFAPNSMLHLAKTLLRMDKLAPAKSALQQLLKKYPKSKRVDEAKRILAKLK